MDKKCIRRSNTIYFLYFFLYKLCFCNDRTRRKLNCMLLLLLILYYYYYYIYNWLKIVSACSCVNNLNEFCTVFVCFVFYWTNKRVFLVVFFRHQNATGRPGSYEEALFNMMKILSEFRLPLFYNLLQMKKWQSHFSELNKLNISDMLLKVRC